MQLEVMQNVLELFVHERMSQGKGVKGVLEKKKGVRMVYGRDEGKTECR